MNITSGEYLVGTLTINIIRAQKLAPRGQGGFADPAVRVYKGGKFEHMTKAANHTLDPVWNEEVVLKLNTPFEQITLEVSNLSGVGSSNSFMGKVDIHTHEFVNEEPKPIWYLLKRQNVDQHVSGDLLLTVNLVYHPKWESALKGGYHLFKRSYALAIQELTDAIQQFAGNPHFLFELYEFRCTAFMGSKNYLLAKEDVAAMSALDKNHPSCFYFLGRVSLSLEDYDQALFAFSQGLEINPGNNRLLHALNTMRKNAKEQTIRKNIDDASKKMRENKPEVAIDIITDALISTDPQNYVYYWYRSIAQIACGRPDLAEKDIRTCCELNPNFPRQMPTKQGKMSKRGRINPALQERYFYLQDRFLFYYKNIKSKEFQGLIILQGAQLDYQKKDLYIKSQSNGNRIFQITVPSGTADAQEWAVAIKNASKLPLVLPTEEPMQHVQSNPIALQNSNGDISQSPKSISILSASPSSSRLSLPSPIGSLSSSLGLPSTTPTHTQVVVSGISYEGWLHKAGEINTSFKKRWFVLRSEILYYFKGKPEAKDDVYTGAQGSIPITKYMVQAVPSPQYGFELLPYIPSGRSYLLHASSESERQRWMDEINLELRRAQATLACKDSERASLEESTDEDCVKMTDSFTNANRKPQKDIPEVRLFTPNTEPDSLDSVAPKATGRGRPTTIYGLDDSSVNAGIVDQRRKSMLFSEAKRNSFLDDDGESDDEYSRLVRSDSSYGSLRSFGDYEEESKGCCSCTIS